MDTDSSDTGTRLQARTSGFVLAAAITCLLNTALACSKDVSEPLKNWMKSIAGHDWTTQGFFDLALFVILGLILTKTKFAEQIQPGRLIGILVAAVAVASVVLVGWYALT